MMRSSLPLIAAVLSMTAILTGCAHTLSPQLQAAATEQGQVQAGVHMPAWPKDCRLPTPHAAVNKGDQQGDVLKHEQAQLDKANDKGDRCSGFYASVKAGLEAPGGRNR